MFDRVKIGLGTMLSVPSVQFGMFPHLKVNENSPAETECEKQVTKITDTTPSENILGYYLFSWAIAIQCL